jgi:hypothetical protein
MEKAASPSKSNTPVLQVQERVETQSCFESLKCDSIPYITKRVNQQVGLPYIIHYPRQV